MGSEPSSFARNFLAGFVVGLLFPGAWKGMLFAVVTYVVTAPVLLVVSRHFNDLQVQGWARCDAQYGGPLENGPNYMDWYNCTTSYHGTPLWAQLVYVLLPFALIALLGWRFSR